MGKIAAGFICICVPSIYSMLQTALAECVCVCMGAARVLWEGAGLLFGGGRTSVSYVFLLIIGGTSLPPPGYARVCVLLLYS